MNKILNITNGDSVADIMKDAGVSGTFLPWRDALHDGPVPYGVSFEKLSELRTQFIVEQGWGTPEYVKDSFLERDKCLKAYEKYSKVLLWFEHDLYDQLQILQILDWFSQHPSAKTQLAIICTDRYLGTLSSNEIGGMSKYEEPISKEQLTLSKRAWAAFRSPSPEMWYELLRTDTSVLPFLEGAILRTLEEYPHCSNGLSRTAQQALKILSQGEASPDNVFRLYQDTEERRFMGDASFCSVLNGLINSVPALIAASSDNKIISNPSPEQKLTITAAGVDVLKGKRNWLDMRQTDRWIGGVHLTADNMWCWNPASGKLIQGSPR